jgi:hypothetical protein
MRTRLTVVVIFALVLSTTILSVRLYQTSKRLEKAEQYLVSSVVSWRMVCTGIEFETRHSRGNERFVWRTLAPLCLDEGDGNAVRDLLLRYDHEGAADLVRARVRRRELPYIIEAGSYDESAFPVGYPD